MKRKAIISFILAAVMVLTFASCKKANLTALDTEATQGSQSQQENTVSESDNTAADTENAEIIQLDPPTIGEEIVVMTTSMGTVKIRLFPEEAPKAVENFKGLIGQNYYDGVIFHRVINNFMIQGGDPTGTGMGGESFFGQDFEIELSDKLFHFRGALAMANTGMENSNSSQFYIVQCPDVTQVTFDNLAYYGYPVEYFPENVINKYFEVGGTPSLDANIYPEGMMVGYTVFGQVFEGMDVVDAIAGVETTTNAMGEKSVPVEPVTIISAELAIYEG